MWEANSLLIPKLDTVCSKQHVFIQKSVKNSVIVVTDVTLLRPLDGGKQPVGGVRF